MLKKLVLAISILTLLVPALSMAQTAGATSDANTVLFARVTSIESQSPENVPDLAISGTDQTLEAEVLSGPDAGTSIEVDNDYIPLKVGDTFYVTRTVDSIDGSESYSMQDPNRMPTLYLLIGLFILLVIVFGGKQGVRGLVSLAGSFVLILFVLMPAIVHGFSPVLVALVVSSLIIILGSYVTHGWNRTTSAAVLGMIATVVITGILAVVSVHGAKLTGMATDESLSLNSNTNGTIDFVSLLLGGIMIGLLGVLYDMAIGQAVAIEELRNIGPHVERTTIFKRALRIGREHIGALVNTLVLAYVGASLPLLLLFYTNVGASAGIHEPLINQEIFATEIVRSLIGAIGIVLAMPITTLISTWMLTKKNIPAGPEELEKEKSAVAHFEHTH